MSDYTIRREDLSDAVICRQDDTALEVAQILRDTQRRNLIVLDQNDCPVGVISAVDVNNRVVAEQKNPEEILAKDFMTKKVATVELNGSVEDAVKTMLKLNMLCLPVCVKGKLIGLMELNKSLKRSEE